MRRLGGLAVVLTVAACSRRPSDSQLQRWSEEVREEEETLKKNGVSSEAANWTLTVRGNIDGEAEYDWQRIVAMANTHVKTTCPTHTKDVKAIVDYRGVLVSDILRAVGAKESDGPGGKELTFVAADGYVGSRKIAEYMRWPVILAIEEDGVQLTKNTGGPLLELLPHTSHPESQRLYAEGGAYYVTTLIVGTERLAIEVGGKTLREKELQALPERVVEGKHAFRARWPSTGDVRIHGPRLRDVLAAAGVKITAEDKLLARRRSKTDTPAREVMTLDGKDVLACDIIVGLRYGSDRALIPAVMGGPAVVALPPACADASRGQPWLTFLHTLTVVPKGDGG